MNCLAQSSEQANKLHIETKEIRRDFHKYPEAGWLEFRTTSKIAEILEKESIPVLLGKQIINTDYVMGYPDKDVVENNVSRALSQGAKEEYIDRMEGYTGAVAIIDTGKPGPVLGLRFDIDSNEVNEKQDQDHRPVKEGFNSQNYDFMHACGHDGHAAIGITTAKILNKIKDNLRGKIKIFFQPAEEGVRGAKAMVESGIVDDVDYFLSGHIGFGAQLNGRLVTTTSGFLATTKIDVEFIGKAAHAGASPQDGSNALLAAASATLNIHGQCQDGRGAARVNVGVLRAGTGRNVVADKAIMKIETRGETTEINTTVYNNTIRILKASGDMYGVDVKIKEVGSASGGSSDKELGEIVSSIAKNIPEVKEIVEEVSLGGSEDVTYMMNRVQERGGKAIYMMFGTSIAAPHHNSGFDFDEDALIMAVKVLTETSYRILSEDYL